ncbi:MAG: LVIVD repeat-containing protein [Promethearchaeota archaeon]
MRLNRKIIVPIIGAIFIGICVIVFGIMIITQNGINVGYEVFVQDNYVFITNNDGTEIHDVSNPSNPIQIGEITTSDGAFGVEVIEDFLYIASDSNGFLIVNISNPDRPVIIGEYSDGGSANSVCVEGSYAYVTEYPRGLEIFDISNPKAITKVSTFDDGGEFRDIALKDGLAYLADPNNGLKVINVSDPSSPSRIRTVSGTHGVIDIYIYEHLMFLGCHGNGVRIIDISTPQSPTILGQYQKSECEVFGVTGNTTHLYVADLQKGVYLLNITDINQPFEIAHYRDATPHDIFYDGEYVYLADQDRELFIFEADLTLVYRGEISIASHFAAIPCFEFAFVIGGLISARFVLMMARKKKMKP